MLTVIYLTYNAGYLDPSAAGQALTEDAVWLAELVAGAMPDQPEAWGLLALLTFLSARTPARFDDVGGLVRLEEQDRTRWDAVAITRADGYLVKAASLRRPGRYQLQAALAGCPLQRGDLGRDRLAADRDAVRHAGPAGRLADRAAEPGDRHEPRVSARMRRWRRSTRWPTGWTGTTCSMPPGPSS